NTPPPTLPTPVHHPQLPPFPTRRSSDLAGEGGVHEHTDRRRVAADRAAGGNRARCPRAPWAGTPSGSTLRWRPPRTPTASRSAPDRKSTRLNSSHLGISYAVFCLKKKKR